MELLPTPIGSERSGVSVEDGEVSVVGLDYGLRQSIRLSRTGIGYGACLLGAVRGSRSAQEVV